MLACSIVPMNSRHLAMVADLEKQSFSRPWSLEQLEESMQIKNYHFLVAEGEEQRFLGFGGMVVVADEGYINNIAVCPCYQKQGVASEILKAFCQLGKQQNLVFLTLEVRVSNAPAIALYEKFGFVKLGERKNYYEAPVENAFILTKNFFEE